MLYSGKLFIGIDLTQGEKVISYSVLNEDLETITLAQGSYQSLLTYLGEQQTSIVGIYGPAQPNQNILTSADRRTQYEIKMGKGRPGNMRVAEYVLKQHKLPTYQTPNTTKDAPAWMQTSFKLYRDLAKLGYQKFSIGTNAGQQMAEVLPEVGFKAWVEGELLTRRSFHGRLQRQLALYEMGINITDPMLYFEEITRYKILQGVLPEEIILPNGTLSALSAAYLAWQTKHQPENITLVGLEIEGQIAIPTELVTNAK
jgi:hypothetical protein